MPFKAWKCVIDKIASTFQGYCLCYFKCMSVKYKRTLFRLSFFSSIFSISYLCNSNAAESAFRPWPWVTSWPTMSLNQRFWTEADNRHFQVSVFFFQLRVHLQRWIAARYKSCKRAQTVLFARLAFCCFSFNFSNTFSSPARPSAVGSRTLCIVYLHARHPLSLSPAWCTRSSFLCLTLASKRRWRLDKLRHKSSVVGYSRRLVVMFGYVCAQK